DALRYYLLRDTPFGLDGNFSYEGLIQRYNSDLANDLGNLASRTLALVHQAAWLDHGVPGWKEATEIVGLANRSGLSPADWEHNISQLREGFEFFGLDEALQALWVAIRATNLFLSEAQPWKRGLDSEPSRIAAGASLYYALETVRIAAVLLRPVTPLGAERLWAQLGCESYLGRLENQSIDRLQWDQLKPGTKVGRPEPIFPRLDKAKALARLDELAEADRKTSVTEKGASVEAKSESQQCVGRPNTTSGDQSPIANHQSQISNIISIEDFAKVDLRAGTVVSAEPIPGATKLLKLQVDIGAEVRQICAGIAEYYKPEDLVGMKVVIVANLRPRKMRGVESNGMVVAASLGDEGKPVLATFAEEVPNGARLK
ncbi:MAG: methionine--tRNA ligase subunit beta, partial [Candidatus Saccharimonadales bacterium]